MQLVSLLCLLGSLGCDSSCAVSPEGGAEGARLAHATDSVVATPLAPDSPPIDEEEGMVTQPPELPRVLLDTRYVPPTGGRTIRVDRGDNLQRAIDRAHRGDIIVLQPGATFTGPFTLPKKSGAGWIVIRSAAPDASLPRAGARITPAYANVLPKLVTDGANESVLYTAAGASHWRLIGLEIAAAPSVKTLNALVRLGDASSDQTGKSTTDLVLDRVYIHGSPTLSLMRCVILSSERTAIVDSYLSECHAYGQDSQAIVGWNGPGPYKIHNNYLEGAGEIIMFGGAVPATPNVIPSDIEIRGNHLYKPVAWKGGPWQIKNIFELKFARRVLFEGNVLDGNWSQAQTGYALVLKTSADMTWAVTEDVTIRLNRVRNVGAGIALNGVEQRAILRARRIAITDNVFENVNVGAYTGDGRLITATNGVTDVTIEHNTMVSTGPLNGAISLDRAPAISRLSFRHNILMLGQYGVKGSGTGAGLPTLAKYAPGATFTQNVFIGAAGAYPLGNFFVPSLAAVGFVNPVAGDWRLAPGSRFRKAGRSVGAEVAAIDSATASVVVR